VLAARNSRPLPMALVATSTTPALGSVSDTLFMDRELLLFAVFHCSGPFGLFLHTFISVRFLWFGQRPVAVSLKSYSYLRAYS
jgi:hypothetical protein